MPSITWSNSWADGTKQGTSWQDYPLSSSSTIPSGANITSITFAIDSYVGRYTGSGSDTFRFYGIGINNGPYSGAGYNDSSPQTVLESTSVNTTSGQTSTGSFQGGTYTKYREGSIRTHFNLSGCTFSNTNTRTCFSSTSINARIRLNNSISGSSTQYITYVSVTVTYSIKPSTPTLSVSNSYPLSTESIDLNWTESTNATSYQVSYGPNGTEYTQNISSGTSWINATKPGNGVTWKYKVRGVGSEYGDWSNERSVITCTKIKHPTTVTVNPTSVTVGSSVTLSWSGASNGSGMNIDTFIIYRSTSVSSVGESITGKSVTSGTTSGSITITAPNTAGTYYYRVEAVRDSWEDYSESFTKDNPYATLTVTVVTGITPPTALKVNGATPTEIIYANTCNMSWTASTLIGISGTITYHIMTTETEDAGHPYTELATTTNTYYNLPNPSSYRTGRYFRIYATCSGYASDNTSSIYYAYRSYGISAPTNLRIGGAAISQDNTNPTVTSSGNLTWGRSILTDLSGTIRYHICISSSGNEIGHVDKSDTDTGDVSFSIPNVASYTGTTNIFVYATNSGYTSTSTGGYFKYNVTTVTPPGKPTISQNNNNTLSISWTASTGTGGTGSITYDILVYGSGTLVTQISNQTSTATVNISSSSIPYAQSLSYVIRAKYSGVTADSESTSFTATEPSITMGNVSSGFSDGVITVSWQNATQSYSSGTIVYHMKIGSGSYFDVTGNSYIVPNPSQYTSATTVTMYASDSFATSSTKTTTIQFTATIKYYDGTAWVDCTVSYYDGTKWVTCVTKYYDGTAWK